MNSKFILNLKKNQVAYFFVKLLLFCGVVFILDFLTGSVLKRFYFKQKAGALYRTTYSIESTNADILIFGSSRATHHYVPDIFEKKLNLSYYNVGKDGNFIFYHYAVLKGILKRYKPKIIILDFINGELNTLQDGYDRISAVLPYIDKHPEMKSIADIKSPYEKIKMVSRTYPYNSLLMSIIGGTSGMNKNAEKEDRGFVPITKIWNTPAFLDEELTFYELGPGKEGAYTAFIDDCIKADIKLYVVCSPYFKISKKFDYSLFLGKKIAKEKNIHFFDFSDDTTFRNHINLFADRLHLNIDGAKLFSERLTDSINAVK